MGTVNAGAPFAFSFWPELEFALLRDEQKWVVGSQTLAIKSSAAQRSADVTLKIATS